MRSIEEMIEEIESDRIISSFIFNREKILDVCIYFKEGKLKDLKYETQEIVKLISILDDMSKIMLFALHFYMKKNDID